MLRAVLLSSESYLVCKYRKRTATALLTHLLKTTLFVMEKQLTSSKEI